MTCPGNLDEGVAGQCDINVDDPDIPENALTCSVNSATTCTGIVVPSDCKPTAQVTVAGQPEASSPGSCVVSVNVSDGQSVATDSSTITINEVNLAPSISLTCPASLDEGVAGQCTIAAGDPDLPANTLTCSINAAATTCAGAALTNNCAGPVTVSAQGETVGPGTCVVAVDVSDGQSVASDSSTITIAEVNQAPAWTISPPALASIIVGGTYSMIGAAGDSDDTAQILTCSINSEDCSFTSVTVSGSGAGTANCLISLSAGLTAETCSASVQVTDGASAITSDITLTVAASFFYVDDSAPVGGTGLTWATAFQDIQAGVDAAFSGCQVWVAEGTYVNDGSTAPVLTMKDGVEVYGGFAGTEVNLADRGNPEDHPTLLDGRFLSQHVVIGGSNSRLDGFVIENGASPADGGGMLIDSKSNVTVSRCVLSANQSGSRGGSMSILASSSVRVEHTVFISNVATMTGGAVFSSSPSVVFDNCLFEANGSAQGGGIYLDGANNIISNCTFSQNSASIRGGALATTTVAVITDTILWNNISGVFSEIYYTPAPPTITYCDIEQSDAAWDPNTGVFNADPAFVSGGSYGNYYLNQVTSPCVDTGSDTAANRGLDSRATDPVDIADAGTIDMGYHYPVP